MTKFNANHRNPKSLNFLATLLLLVGLWSGKHVLNAAQERQSQNQNNDFTRYGVTKHDCQVMSCHNAVVASRQATRTDQRRPTSSITYTTACAYYSVPVSSVHITML